MVETAIAISIVKPLASAVFAGIVGGAAHSLTKTLWHRPREDVGEVEQALMIAARDAVLDCYEHVLEHPRQPLTQDEKARIKSGIKEFRKSKKDLKKLKTELPEAIKEWGEAVPGQAAAPSKFGPLVGYAGRDMPGIVGETLATRFSPAR